MVCVLTVSLGIKEMHLTATASSEHLAQWHTLRPTHLAHIFHEVELLLYECKGRCEMIVLLSNHQTESESARA